MKHFLFAVLLLLPLAASAQSNGGLPSNPGGAGAPCGTNGQLQYNNNGVCGGLTPNTLNSGAYAGSLVKNTYTAAGAITVSDDLSILNATASVTMTLANDTVDNRRHIIKCFGAGSCNVTGMFDGVSQTINMSPSGTRKADLVVDWIASLSSYIVE